MEPMDESNRKGVRVSLVNVPQQGRSALLAHLFKRTAQWIAQDKAVAWLMKDAETAKRMDERLWTFDDTGFLPHSILGPASSPLDPVVLVVGNGPPINAKVVLNFRSDPVDLRYLEGATDGEVLDFVDTSNPEGEQTGRNKWEFYKKAPVELKHVDMAKGDK